MADIFYLIETISLCIMILIAVLLTISYKIKLNMYFITYYLFCIFFILPELQIRVFGFPNGIYKGFLLIKDNLLVDVIWFIVTLIQYCIILYMAIKKGKRINYTIDLKNIKIPQGIRIIAWILLFVPTASAIFSPQPSLYFAAFGPFYRRDVYNVTEAAVDYHYAIMSKCLNLSILGIIILWLYSQNKKQPILRFFVCAVALEILLFSNKRTLGSLIILMMLIIDIYFNKKNNLMKIISVCGFLIIYFIFYHVYVKYQDNSSMLNFSYSYQLYFGRVLDMKLIIYSLLNPDVLKILEYPGQSLLFDVLFFVPRTLWKNKPYPFAMYYSAAVHMWSIDNVNGRFLTSFFAEIICNLSWAGVLIGPWIYYKIINFVEKIDNKFMYFFAVYTCIYLFITQIGSNLYNLLILVLLYFLKKCKFKKIKIKIKLH